MEDKTGGNLPGTSKAISPSSSVENPNESSADLFASRSREMHESGVDIAEIIMQDRVRILELERKVKSLEERMEMMARGRIPTAGAGTEEEPTIPPQDPGRVNPPPNPPSVSAPAGRARRTCEICGKNLSVSYFFRHQQLKHPPES